MIKSFDFGWNNVSLYASRILTTQSIPFFSIDSNPESKDGIDITSNVASNDPFRDTNVLFAQCQEGFSLFKTTANQRVFVSHPNGNLKISFCDLNFWGQGGASSPITARFSGHITQE